MSTTKSALEIRIGFGPCAPKIREQLAEQGAFAPSDAVALWQRQADAVTLLYVHDLLSEKARDVARRKLFRNILNVTTEAQP